MNWLSSFAWNSHEWFSFIQINVSKNQCIKKKYIIQLGWRVQWDNFLSLWINIAGISYTYATFDGISLTFLYLPDQTRILLSKLLSLWLADAAFCHGWAELVDDGVDDDSVDGVCGCDGDVGGVDDDLSRIRFVCDKKRTLISLRNVIIGTALAFLIINPNIMLVVFFGLLSQKLNFGDLYRNKKIITNFIIKCNAFLTLTFETLHNQNCLVCVFFFFRIFVFKGVLAL